MFRRRRRCSPDDRGALDVEHALVLSLAAAVILLSHTGSGLLTLTAVAP